MPGNDFLANGLFTLFNLVLSPNLFDGVGKLTTTVANYNTDAYAFANNINSTIVKPIAATILAIILVLDLARIGSRVDGDQRLGVQMVATSVIKAVLVIIAIQNVHLILGAINQVGDTVIKTVGASTGGTLSNSVPSEDELKTVDLMGQLGTMVVLLIPALLGVIASIVLKVVVFVRFAEIYVLSAAATLPLVFMGHPETKGIAVGFLKKYAQAVLQGVILIIVLHIFTLFKLGNGVKIDAANLIGSTVQAWPGLFLGSAVFLFFIISSGRFARALVGE